MLPTKLIDRLTSLTRTLNRQWGCLLALLILFAPGVQGAGPATPKADNIATLIQQLGVDASTDTATRGKLRAMLAQDQTLPAITAAGDIQQGLWSGVIERVYVDNLDAQGNLVPGPTQFYLNTGTGHLQVFFMDEAKGHAANGQHRVIRGYRTGRRVLALEDNKNQRDLFRPDKVRGNNKP